MESTLASAEINCVIGNGNTNVLRDILETGRSISRLALRSLHLPLGPDAETATEDEFLMRVASAAASQRATLEEQMRQTQVRPIRALLEKLLRMGDLFMHAGTQNGHGESAALEAPTQKHNRVKTICKKNPANGRAPNPNIDEATLALWRAFEENPSDESLRNQLVEKYVSLVKSNAERIWLRLPDGVELDDLVSAGIFGLMDAINGFDLSRGCTFEAYCVPRIRGAMLDELRNMDWVPRLVRTRASKLNKAVNILEIRLGRQPTEEELAAHLDMTMPKLEKMMRETSAPGVISLQKKWYETDSYKDVREIDILEDKKAETPHGDMDRMDALRILLRGLDQRERLILISYYWEDMTMREIGESLELSESRVSQMHSKLLVKIQNNLAAHLPHNDGAADFFPLQPDARDLLSFAMSWSH